MTPKLGVYWTLRQPKDDQEPARDCKYIDNAYRLPSRHHLETIRFKLRSRIAPAYQHLMEESHKGSPPSHLVMIDGVERRITLSGVEWAAMVSTFAPALAEWGQLLAVEIGGGYGGLAAAVLRANLVSDYVILDIPSVARISRWYLADERRARVIDVGRDDEIIKAADLIIQTRGFMEMSGAEIAHYFELIQAAKPGALFYCVNRYRKVTELVDWPWDACWRVRVARHWIDGCAELLLERSDTQHGELQMALEEIRETGRLS